jgi:hypothetical protein
MEQYQSFTGHHTTLRIENAVYVGIETSLSELVEYDQQTSCRNGHARKNKADAFCPIDGNKFETMPKPPIRPSEMFKKVIDIVNLEFCDICRPNECNLEKWIEYLTWPVCSFYNMKTGKRKILVGNLVSEDYSFGDTMTCKEIEGLIDNIKEIRSKVVELGGRNIKIFNSIRFKYVCAL